MLVILVPVCLGGSDALVNCFNLAIEMLVILVRACGAPDTPWLNTRTSAIVHFQHDGAC